MYYFWLFPPRKTKSLKRTKSQPLANAPGGTAKVEPFPLQCLGGQNILRGSFTWVAGSTTPLNTIPGCIGSSEVV